MQAENHEIVREKFLISFYLSSDKILDSSDDMLLSSNLNADITIKSAAVLIQSVKSKIALPFADNEFEIELIDISLKYCGTTYIIASMSHWSHAKEITNLYSEVRIF